MAIKRADCWHCEGSGSCDCIFHGKDVATAGVVSRMAAQCGVCVALDFNERHRRVLDSHDPGNPKNWEYHPAHDGNPKRLIYIPTKGLS